MESRSSVIQQDQTTLSNIRRAMALIEVGFFSLVKGYGLNVCTQVIANDRLGRKGERFA